MEQAKARNPNIKLYGLAWGAPGWIGNGNFWSTDMINYLVSWLGCAKQHGLTIDYLGGWNERGYNVSWYEQLRSALNANGYGASRSSRRTRTGAWPTTSTPTRRSPPRWTSSAPTTPAATGQRPDHLLGALGRHRRPASRCGPARTARTTTTAARRRMARGINRGYIDGRMTAYLNWPVVAALTPEPAVPHRWAWPWPRSPGPAATRSARTPG